MNIGGLKHNNWPNPGCEALREYNIHRVVILALQIKCSDGHAVEEGNTAILQGLMDSNFTGISTLASPKLIEKLP
jgi:hypothetical protein